MKPWAKTLIAAAILSAGGMTGALAPCALAGDASDPHAHHHHMMMEAATRTTADYKLPRLSLVRADGKTVSLADELNDGRAVALNFMFTTCTTICPVTSGIFSQLQDNLHDTHDKVHLVSISIDPQQDTPAVLREYAKKFGAGKEWQFYTGTLESSIAVQRAFDVYRGDKMSHTQVTLLRAAPGKPWLRVDGSASADELLRDLRAMIAVQ